MQEEACPIGAMIWLTVEAGSKFGIHESCVLKMVVRTQKIIEIIPYCGPEH
jgi:hypothetical protein